MDENEYELRQLEREAAQERLYRQDQMIGNIIASVMALGVAVLVFAVALL